MARRRFFRGLARALLWAAPVAVTAAAITLGAAFSWLRTEAGNDWLLAGLLPRIQPAAGAIEVDSLRTDLLHELHLRGVRIRDPDGAVVVGVAEADASFDAESLVGRTLPVHDLRLAGVVVDIPEPGVFSTMWPGDPTVPAAPWGGLPVDLLVETARIDGRVDVSGQAFDSVNLQFGLEGRGRQLSWSKLSLSAATAAGPLVLSSDGAWSPETMVVQTTRLGLGAEHENHVALRGAVDKGNLAVDLDTVHFDKDGLLALVPALADVPLRAPLDATGRLTGTFTAPNLSITVATAGGPLTLSGASELAAKRWALTVDTPGLDTEPAFSGLPTAHVAGHAEATGTGWTWPDELDAAARLDVQVRAGGETVAVKGPVAVAGGVLTLDHVRADAGWVTTTASGAVKVLDKAAELDVHGLEASLGRFGIGGSAGFVGHLSAGWDGPVALQADGRVRGRGLAAGGATIASAEGPVFFGYSAGRPSGSAELAVGEVSVAGRHAEGGSLHASIVDDSVSFDLQLHEPDRPIVDLAGTYGLSPRTVHLDRATVEVAPGLSLAARGPQELRLVPGGVADAALSLDLGTAHLDARGAFAQSGDNALVVDVAGLDLSQLSRVFPGQFVDWGGTVSGHAGLVGTLDAPRVEGVLSGTALQLPGAISGLDTELVLQAGPDGLTFDATAGPAAAPLLVAKGRLPLQLGRHGVDLARSGPIEASFILPPAATAALRERLPGAARIPDLDVSAELRAGGTLAAPSLVLVASADVPVSNGGPTVRLWLDAALADGVLTSRVVLNQAFVSRLETDLAARVDIPAIERWIAGGPAPAKVDTLFTDFGGAVVLKQLPLATVRKFAPFKGDVDGALAGAFALSGSPLRPRVQGGVNVVGARVGQLAVAPATLNLAPLPGGYQVQAMLGFNLVDGAGTSPTCARAAGDPAGSVEVEGFVPLDDSFALDRPGLSLRVAGEGVPLAAAEAFSAALVDTGGCLALGGTIGGSLVDPALALGFNLSRGVSTLPSLGVRLEGIDIDGRFQDQNIQVDHAHLETKAGLDPRAGSIDASGHITLDHWIPKGSAGTIVLDQAWLASTGDRRARVSGKLDLKGSGATLDVAGSLRVDEGYLHLPERFFADARRTRLHPDIEVIRPGEAVAAVEAGEAAAFSLDIRPNVKVDLDHHVQVSVAMPLQGGYGDLARSLSTITVESDADGLLTVTRKGGKLKVKGELTTSRGSASVLGRPFDVGEGTIAFPDGDPAAPDLKLVATHHADCGDINVAITGVPGAPVLDFTSDALPDRDAVLRALVLGTCETSSDAAQDDALTQTLGLLADALSKQARTYGDAAGASPVRLEKLELDPSGTARVGLSLGRNVFLTTEYNPTPATPDDNQFSLTLELSLPYRWYLAIDTGDKGASALSAYRKWRF